MMKRIFLCFLLVGALLLLLVACDRGATDVEEPSSDDRVVDAGSPSGDENDANDQGAQDDQNGGSDDQTNGGDQGGNDDQNGGNTGDDLVDDSGEDFKGGNIVVIG